MIMVELKLPKTSSGLAGFEYGKKVYEEQIKEKYSDYAEGLTIQFPDYIERVASSFVQGLFSELVTSIGYDRIKQNVIIESKSNNLTSTIWDRLY